MTLLESTLNDTPFVTVRGGHIQSLGDPDEQGRYRYVLVKKGTIEPEPSGTSTSIPPEPLLPAPTDTPQWHVSKAFRDRVWKYAFWDEGWEEGAERITYPTAGTALVIADRMADIAGDPFVAPATDGSLILLWKFEDRSSVEVYIDPDEDHPTWASVIEGGAVDEITLEDDGSLVALLKDRASRPT